MHATITTCVTPGRGYACCFISKLDHCLDTDLPKTSHPRLDHRVGSPRDKNVPSGCKKWIVKKELWVNAGDIDEATEQGDVDASDSDSA